MLVWKMCVNLPNVVARVNFLQGLRPTVARKANLIIMAQATNIKNCNAKHSRVSVPSENRKKRRKS